MDSLRKNELITDILRRCFPDASCIKTTFKLNCDGSESFTSCIVNLIMEYTQNNQQKFKHLILKDPKGADNYELFSKFNFYVKEKCMYEIIMPLMEKYINSKLVPTYYPTTLEENLILDNLTVKGYICGKRREFMNFDQSIAALQILAQFHAASFEISQQYPHVLNDPIFEKPILLDMGFRKILLHLPESLMQEMLSRCHSSDLPQKFKHFLSLLKQSEDQIYPNFNPYNLKFIVLNHGDYRKDNLLLKYDTKGLVEDIKVIDLQSCWWSSPIVDLFNFLLTSVHYKEAEKNLDVFINLYIQYLNEALKTIGCVNSYSKDDLMFDIKKGKLLMFLLLICGCQHWIPRSIPNLNEMFSVEENIDEIFIAIWNCWLKIYENLEIF